MNNTYQEFKVIHVHCDRALVVRGYLRTRTYSGFLFQIITRVRS